MFRTTNFFSKRLSHSIEYIYIFLYYKYGVKSGGVLVKGDYKLVMRALLSVQDEEKEKDDDRTGGDDTSTTSIEESVEFELFHLRLNTEDRVDGECEDVDEDPKCNSIFNIEK
jgi:hypothetical protein